MSDAEDKRRMGATTLAKSFADRALDEMSRQRSENQKFREEALEREKRMREDLQDAIRRVEEREREREDASLKRDEEQNAKIEVLTAKLIEIEKEQAVNKAKSSGAGAIAGGGIAGIVMLIKSLLMG